MQRISLLAAIVTLVGRKCVLADSQAGSGSGSFSGRSLVNLTEPLTNHHLCTYTIGMRMDGGEEISTIQITNTSDCCSMCNKLSRCFFFSSADGRCSLFAKAGELISDSSAVCGTIIGREEPTSLTSTITVSSTTTKSTTASTTTTERTTASATTRATLAATKPANPKARQGRYPVTSSFGSVRYGGIVQVATVYEEVGVMPKTDDAWYRPDLYDFNAVIAHVSGKEGVTCKELGTPETCTYGGHTNQPVVYALCGATCRRVLAESAVSSPPTKPSTPRITTAPSTTTTETTQTTQTTDTTEPTTSTSTTTASTSPSTSTTTTTTTPTTTAAAETDEQSESSTYTCEKMGDTGRWQCPNSTLTVPCEYVCDSFEDCYHSDGDDEEAEFCRTWTGDNTFGEPRSNQCTCNETTTDPYSGETWSGCGGVDISGRGGWCHSKEPCKDSHYSSDGPYHACLHLDPNLRETGAADNVFGTKELNNDALDRMVSVEIAGNNFEVEACGNPTPFCVARDSKLLVVNNEPGLIYTTDQMSGTTYVSWDCLPGEEFVFMLYDSMGGSKPSDDVHGSILSLQWGLQCSAWGQAGMTTVDASGVQAFAVNKTGVKPGHPFYGYNPPANPAAEPNTYHFLVFLSNSTNFAVDDPNLGGGSDGLSTNITKYLDDNGLDTLVGRAYAQTVGGYYSAEVMQSPAIRDRFGVEQAEEYATIACETINLTFPGFSVIDAMAGSPVASQCTPSDCGSKKHARCAAECSKCWEADVGCTITPNVICIEDLDEYGDDYSSYFGFYEEDGYYGHSDWNDDVYYGISDDDGFFDGRGLPCSAYSACPADVDGASGSRFASGVSGMSGLLGSGSATSASGSFEFSGSKFAPGMSGSSDFGSATSASGSLEISGSGTPDLATTRPPDSGDNSGSGELSGSEELRHDYLDDYDDFSGGSGSGDDDDTYVQVAYDEHSDNGSYGNDRRRGIAKNPFGQTGRRSTELDHEPRVNVCKDNNKAVNALWQLAGADREITCASTRKLFGCLDPGFATLCPETCLQCIGGIPEAMHKMRFGESQSLREDWTIAMERNKLTLRQEKFEVMQECNAKVAASNYMCTAAAEYCPSP